MPLWKSHSKDCRILGSIYGPYERPMNGPHLRDFDVLVASEKRERHRV